MSHLVIHPNDDVRIDQFIHFAEPMSPTKWPQQVGHVQLLKPNLTLTRDTFDGFDLVNQRSVIVRQLDREKHINRLRLACRLSIPICDDADELKKLYDLIFPPATTFVLFREKLNHEAKLNFYWIEPPHYGSFHDYVIERKRLTEMQSQNYFRQICRIVEFFHARNVVLRDLKLRKFVFADEERLLLKLVDVDESLVCPENKGDPDRIIYADFDPENDRICDRRGCPPYVSPEVLNLSQKWLSGKASDIWSLGVLLYVLSLGRYPFYDVTTQGLFAKIRDGQIYLSSEELSFQLRLLIRGILRVDPKDRPSATDILANRWLNPVSQRKLYFLKKLQKAKLTNFRFFLNIELVYLFFLKFFASARNN